MPFETRIPNNSPHWLQQRTGFNNALDSATHWIQQRTGFSNLPRLKNPSQ